MKIFNLLVNETNISREDELEKLPSSTLRYAKCQFAVEGEGWQVDQKYAIFQRRNSDGDVVIEKPKLLIDNSCFIPPEIIDDSGTIYVNVCGFNAEDVDEERQIIHYRINTFQAKLVKCVYVPYHVDGTEVEPTPSLFEQFIARVSNLLYFGVEDETLVIGESVNARVSGETLEIYAEG